MKRELIFDEKYNKKSCARSVLHLYEILPTYPNRPDCEYAIYLLLNFVEDQELVRFLNHPKTNR